MENQQPTKAADLGLDFWTNYAVELEKAMEGIKVGYALLAEQHSIAQNNINNLAPEREEII